MSSTKPILISGGGLASLLLGCSLLRQSIPFLIFERDESISFRAQGYRLRLSSEGLDAIESVLGPESFQKFWEKCGKTGGAKGLTSVDAITGQDGAVDLDTAASSSKPPSTTANPNNPSAATSQPAQPASQSLTSRGGQTIGISRGDMRALFLEGCEAFVKWNHHVVGYEHTPSGVHAIFKDGSRSVEGSLLVGGEGIYSRVAKQVSNGRLKTFDTCARGVHGQAPTTAFKGLGEGVWRITDDSDPSGKVFVITNVRPDEMHDPTVKFGWTMGGQPGRINPPNDDFALLGKPAADIARSIAKNWHPRVKDLVEQMDDSEAAFWKITCSSPSGVPVWDNDERVTVIGDAVHSMTPAGGIGANTAVRDSELLGKLLGQAGGWKEGITAEYERQMRVYASEAVATSYGMATSQFGVSIDEKTSPTVGS